MPRASHALHPAKSSNELPPLRERLSLPARASRASFLPDISQRRNCRCCVWKRARARATIASRCATDNSGRATSAHTREACATSVSGNYGMSDQSCIPFSSFSLPLSAWMSQTACLTVALDSVKRPFTHVLLLILLFLLASVATRRLLDRLTLRVCNHIEESLLGFMTLHCWH